MQLFYLETYFYLSIMLGETATAKAAAACNTIMVLKCLLEHMLLHSVLGLKVMIILLFFCGCVSFR